MRRRRVRQWLEQNGLSANQGAEVTGISKSVFYLALDEEEMKRAPFKSADALEKIFNGTEGALRPWDVLKIKPTVVRKWMMEAANDFRKKAY